MIRSAPVGGYNAYGAKREYRRQVWATMARMLGEKAVARANALILPSKEGDEIRVAISKGVREDRIHAVDRNPALIATASWRRTHPKVRAYGSEIVRAGERIAGSGIKIDVANLDLCSCASRSLKETLRDFGQTGVLADRAVVAITILRGRETKPQTAELDYWADVASEIGMDTKLAESLIGNRGLNQRDVGRMAVVAHAMCAASRRAWKPERLSVYRTHRSTMLWFVMDTISLDSQRVTIACDEMEGCVEAAIRELQEGLEAFEAIGSNALKRPDRREQLAGVRRALEMFDHASKRADRWFSRAQQAFPLRDFVGIPMLGRTREALTTGRLDSAAIKELLGDRTEFDRYIESL